MSGSAVVPEGAQASHRLVEGCPHHLAPQERDLCVLGHEVAGLPQHRPSGEQNTIEAPQVRCHTAMELVSAFNLATARALGVTISQAMRLRADEVIE